MIRNIWSIRTMVFFIFISIFIKMYHLYFNGIMLFLLYLFPPMSCDKILVILSHIFLLYLFPPESCDKILFILSQIFLLYLIASSLVTRFYSYCLRYFCYSSSLQALILSIFSYFYFYRLISQNNRRNFS